MAAGMAWLPPSPRWLLLRAQQQHHHRETRGQEGEDGQDGQAGARGEEARRRAVEAVRRLRGGACGEGEARREVQGMVEAMGEGGGKGGASGWGELVAGASGRALVIACGLVFFQQVGSSHSHRGFMPVCQPTFIVTGQPSVLYYAGSILQVPPSSRCLHPPGASILQDAGFSAATDATRVSVLLGLFKQLGMTGVAIATVDRWGRRPLLLAGVSGLVGTRARGCQGSWVPGLVGGRACGWQGL
ncbi:unnamed protein product [Closterium sp. NIES-64]|nr:unnamed protein product [Closterium sp. NIES-64]